MRIGPYFQVKVPGWIQWVERTKPPVVLLLGDVFGGHDVRLVKAVSPQTIVVYRHYVGTQALEPADREAAAFFGSVRNSLGTAVPDIVLGYNEVLVSFDPLQAKAFAAWTIEYAKLCAAQGYNFFAFCLNCGHFDKLWDPGATGQALREALAHPAVKGISLHRYLGCGPDNEYELLRANLPAHLRKPVLFSEYGVTHMGGLGHPGGWRQAFPDPEKYLLAIQRYASRYAAFSEVVGLAWWIATTLVDFEDRSMDNWWDVLADDLEALYRMDPPEYWKPGAPPPPPPPPQPGGDMELKTAPYLLALLLQICGQFDMDPHLVAAVIQRESEWYPLARGDYDAVRGYRSFGLGQLNLSGDGAGYPVEVLLDPESNLWITTARLKARMNIFKGDLRMVISSWNQGIAGAQRRGWQYTRDYVEDVLRFYQRFKESGLEGTRGTPNNPTG